MPIRIEFTEGGAFLVPYAKRKLQALTARAEALGVPLLTQRIVVDPGGHIDLQYNATGIDTIKIVWKDKLTHGFITWPASDTAPFGWGKPFSDDNGNPINPPLGTVLESNGDFEREVRLSPRHSETPQDNYKLRRRLSEIGRGQSVWFSKDRKTVVTANISANSLQSPGTNLYLWARGEKIATYRTTLSNIPGDNLNQPRLMAFGVYTDAEDKKRYLWSVLKSFIPIIGHVLWSYRTPFVDKIKKIDDPDNPGQKKEFTEWTLLGEKLLTTEGAFFLNGAYDPSIAFAGGGANASATEAVMVYCDNSFRNLTFTIDGPHQRAFTSQDRDLPSGHVLVTRTPFDVVIVPNNRKMTVPADGNGSAIIGDSNGFVFDAGYRVDELVLARHITDYLTVGTTQNLSVNNPASEFYVGIHTLNQTLSYRARVVSRSDGTLYRDIPYRVGDIVSAYTRTQTVSPDRDGADNSDKAHELWVVSTAVRSTHILFYNVARDFLLTREDKFTASYTINLYYDRDFSLSKWVLINSSCDINVQAHSSKYVVSTADGDHDLGAPKNNAALFSVSRQGVVPTLDYLPTAGIVTWPYVERNFTPLAQFGIEAAQVGESVESAVFSNEIVILAPYYKFRYDLRKLDHRYESRIHQGNHVHAFVDGGGGQASLSGIYTFNVECAFFLDQDERVLTFYSIPYTDNRPTTSAIGGSESTYDEWAGQNAPPGTYNPLPATGAFMDINRALYGPLWLINPQGGWGELAQDIRWKNYLTGADPVIVTEIVGERPRFNDIGVI